MLGVGHLMYLRFLGLSTNSIGEKLQIVLKNSKYLQGIFYSVDTENFNYIIISLPKISDDNANYQYTGENFLKIMMDDISFCKIVFKNVKRYAKGVQDFQTDVDISKKTSSANLSKGLIQYTVDQLGELFMNNLEDENHKWNQFELNKEKFNVVTSYEEKHYTTELDHSVIPQQIKEKADLIVKDILENSPLNNNLHLMEERGFIDQADGDEEDKYSSVLRNENSQHIN